LILKNRVGPPIVGYIGGGDDVPERTGKKAKAEAN